jgi:uroporphyrinogen-III synthase
MPPRSAPRLVLLSAPGTLAGVDPLLRRARVRVVRIALIVPRPVEPERWLSRVRSFAPPDTVIVTSRTAVAAGVQPWLRTREGRHNRVEFWASGPGTARALQTAGVRRVRRPRAIGAQGVRVAFRGRPPRTVLYFRSNRAGPALARQLRAEGHRVVDVVVYRLAAAPKLGRKARRDLLKADLLVATSPSILSELRRGLDRQSFLSLRRRAHLVVLGLHSQRAARGHGFRGVSVAPSTTGQGFTRYLLQELRDASA